jgi:hypothetical protein
MKWYERPTKILSINEEIDYIMCIEENGSSGNLAYILKQISNEEQVLEEEKYFTITGCIFTKKEYLKYREEIEKLKTKYWEDGMFYDEKINKNKAVCFHSRDIRKHNNCFNDKLINYEEFMIDLTSVMKNIDCKIISISINLYEYLKKGYTHNVYNVAFDFLLERYIYATKSSKKGLIMLEARGKEEDSELLKHIAKVINKTGTKKISSKELKYKIKGVYFNPKWNEEYSSTYVGLKITDLFSYPIHKYIKRSNKDRAFMTFEDKIVGYPNYEKKGIKKFP